MRHRTLQGLKELVILMGYLTGIDSSLPDDFARSIICGLSSAVTVITLTVVGGPLALVAVMVFGFLFYDSEFISS